MTVKTVRDWLACQTPAPPLSLTERLLSTLGADADADQGRTSEVCLGAAARLLETLLSESRFARASALDLLAIDALVTYAFEHASEARDGGRRLRALTERATRTVGQLMTQRV